MIFGPYETKVNGKVNGKINQQCMLTLYYEKDNND